MIQNVYFNSILVGDLTDNKNDYVCYITCEDMIGIEYLHCNSHSTETLKNVIILHVGGLSSCVTLKNTLCNSKFILRNKSNNVITEVGFKDINKYFEVSDRYKIKLNRVCSISHEMIDHYIEWKHPEIYLESCVECDLLKEVDTYFSPTEIEEHTRIDYKVDRMDITLTGKKYKVSLFGNPIGSIILYLRQEYSMYIPIGKIYELTHMDYPAIALDRIIPEYLCISISAEGYVIIQGKVTKLYNNN